MNALHGHRALKAALRAVVRFDDLAHSAGGDDVSESIFPEEISAANFAVRIAEVDAKTAHDERSDDALGHHHTGRIHKNGNDVALSPASRRRGITNRPRSKANSAAPTSDENNGICQRSLAVARISGAV